MELWNFSSTEDSYSRLELQGWPLEFVSFFSNVYFLGLRFVKLLLAGKSVLATSLLTYVTHLRFLRGVCIRTQSATVASWFGTTLPPIATHLSSKIAKLQLGWIMPPPKLSCVIWKEERPLPHLAFYHFKYLPSILMNGQNWKSDRNSAVMTRAEVIISNNQLIDRHRVNKWKLEHQTGSARTQPIEWCIKTKAVDWLAWNKGFFRASWLDGLGRMIKPEQLIG